MRRFTTMRLGIASFLSCLALLLGAFTSTGTASAHTVSAQRVHPFINVFDVSRFGHCVDFRITGGDFTPDHRALLRADSPDAGVSIDPSSVHVNGAGNFARHAVACVNFARFSRCGDFIDNPSFFCGFNLNPEEFCRSGFAFEPSEFCFPGVRAFPPSRFCPPGTLPRFCHLRRFPSRFCQPFERFRCGFRPFPVFRFCGFHFLPFCFRFRHHTLTLFITALDSFTGRESNTAKLRFGNFFF